MLYFKILAFFFGLSWTVAAGMAQWVPAVYTSFVLNTFLPPQKPRWLIPFAVFLVVWTLATWVVCIFFLTPLTLMTTGFLTLGVFKMALILPYYDTVRKAIEVLLTTEKFAFNMVKISSFVIGVGFLAIGLFL